MSILSTSTKLESVQDLSKLDLTKLQWQDLANRSLSGCLLLLPLWLVIGYLTGIYQNSPTFFVINILILICSEMTRFRYITLKVSNATDDYEGKIKTVSRMILFSGLHWGLVIAWLLHLESLSVHQFYAIVVIKTAIATAGAATFMTFNRLGVQYPLLIITPALIGGFVYNTPYHEVYSILTLVLLTHIFLTNDKATNAFNFSQHQLETLDHDSRKAKALSKTDYLTKLGNRFYFKEEYEKAWLKSKPLQAHTSLIFVDIKLLNQINDQHGYQTGDAVIQSVAEVIASNVSAPSFVARYGGSEFAICLTNTDLEQATDFARNIQEKVCAIEFVHDNSKIQLTCSLGLISDTIENAEEAIVLLNNVRKSLHNAKQHANDTWANLTSLRVFDLINENDHKN